MLRRTLLAATALCALTGVAAAADLPTTVPASIPAPVAPRFNWTGFYVGGQIGWQWMDDRTTATTFAGVPAALGGLGGFAGFSPGISGDGFIGGVHLGYNQQLQQIVVGIEGDFEGADVNGRSNLLNGSSVRSDLRWEGSVRGRLGVLVQDNLLLYGTGGVAFGDIRHRYFNAATGLGDSFNSTETGWTVGAGAEYAFAPNWTARLEYRYTDFGSTTHTSLVAFPGVNIKQEPTFNSVRFGVSYKF